LFKLERLSADLDKCTAGPAVLMANAPLLVLLHPLSPSQLYINGPYWVNGDDLTLRSNPGSWNRLYGLLYIEQPISTGFSLAGKNNFLPKGVCLWLTSAYQCA